MNKTMKAFLAGPYGVRVKDYYKCGDGYHDVLMRGFCDDGDSHVIIERSVVELIKRVKAATPCNCECCLSGVYK